MMTRRSIGFAAGLCLAVGMVFVAGLSAHLAVSKTLPANGSTIGEAPARVQIWFTEAPSARVSRLEMKGPSGEVPLGAVEIDPKTRSMAAAVRGPLAPGRYEVAWRTAGKDGHVMRGTFTFSLKAAK
jgi:methionine-rich copper-binding protein CopC